MHRGRRAFRPDGRSSARALGCLRTGERRHLLLLTVHHVAADGWSMSVLWREVAEVYRATTERRPPELPELPVRYADYAAWQRRWLNGDRLARLLDYWRERLSGLEPLELPTDRPRPSNPSYRGDRLDFKLPAALVDRLRALCLDTSVTIQMALMAVFQMVLALHRTRRRRRRRTHRGQGPARARRPDRLLRQHLGPPR